MGPTAKSTPRESIDGQSGAALIVVLMGVTFMTALGIALTLTTSMEERIAGTVQHSVEAAYAADAALERALPDLAALPDWNAALTGQVQSTLTDAGPNGVRPGAGGLAFDLTTATARERCGRPACGLADLAAVTADRPWGRNNPIWQPYLYGPLSRLLPGRINSPAYVVVWVGDDPAENDDDPLRDGGLPVGCDPALEPGCEGSNSGRERVVLRATAYGPEGVQRTVQATVVRAERVRVVAWRELR